MLQVGATGIEEEEEEEEEGYVTSPIGMIRILYLRGSKIMPSIVLRFQENKESLKRDSNSCSFFILFFFDLSPPRLFNLHPILISIFKKQTGSS
jgi:hypothetical protein